MAVQEAAPQEANDLAGLETQLATTLAETSDEIAHADCLDRETRAEVYTILEILKSDTKIHREIIGRYVSQKDAPDA